jgi:hypothetical protein
VYVLRQEERRRLGVPVVVLDRRDERERSRRVVPVLFRGRRGKRKLFSLAWLLFCTRTRRRTMYAS